MRKINTTPHDKFFRTAMSDPRVAKEFFESHLPTNILCLVDLEKLVLRKDSFVDEHLKLSVTDMLFSVPVAGKAGYLYLLAEHQSTPQELMPFRLLKYMLEIMAQHLKEAKDNTLSLVYPIIFYNGKEKYNYSTNFFDLFGGNKRLAQEILLQPFQLVDVKQISDEQLQEKVWAGVMELCMKRIFASDILPYLPDMLKLFKVIENANAPNYVVSAVNYLLLSGEISNKQVLFEAIHNNLSSEVEANIMTIAQQLRNEGHIEGRTEGETIGLRRGEVIGLMRGQAEAKKSIAQRLIQQGMSLEVISQVTELSIDEINQLTQSSTTH